MISRLAHVLVVLAWLVLGLALILAPWSDIWDANYFLYLYPELAFFLKSAYLRGAVSGLGFLDVLLSLEALRHWTSAVAARV